MKRQWIKLYIEIIDDPKMGRLPDRLWKRAVEFFMLAGENDADGNLPAVEDMAWRLRSSPEDIAAALRDLEGLIVHFDGKIWVVTKFKDRQFSESYERVKRYRARFSNTEGNEEETEKESPSSSTSNSFSNSLEGGGAGEETKPASKSDWIPKTPKQAGSHPDIQTYINVSGRFPGQREYQTIIETVQCLREKQGEALEDYLKKFWTAWSSRKTKDNKPYSPSSLVWLCEWAMQGDIPRTNGHEPKINQDRQAIIRKVAQHAR